MNIAAFFRLMCIGAIFGCLQSPVAYDVGCIYPERMPDPHEAFVFINVAGAARFPPETPIALFNAFLGQLAENLCLAYHDDKVLNPLTMRRPFFSVPSFGHNAFSQVLCYLQAVMINVRNFDISPFYENEVVNEWGNIDLRFSYDQELLQAVQERDGATIQRILTESDFHPFMIGQLVSLETLAFAFGLGWNMDGRQSFDFSTGQPVACGANCAPFADTTGYIPRNTPGRPSLEKDKYNISGLDRFWQPLLENDGSGYFSRQEHVTPHIGWEAEPLIAADIVRNRTLNPPDYNYYEESLQVIEELRQTAESTERQNMIRFFDDKRGVKTMYEHLVGLSNVTVSMSYQMFRLLGLAGGFAEYAALVAAWREKRNHDLVRPTTVIQRWGDDPILTYVDGEEKAVNISARDFQAFIRVMPHSEFPSGSGAICSGYMEVVDGFLDHFYGVRLENMTVGYGGYNLNCDGKYWPSTTSFQVGCVEPPFTIANMTHLRDLCGSSRLWGGMHYSKSVPASYELAAGIGTAAVEKVKEILNNSTFSGNAHYIGDPRPVCPSDATSSPSQSPMNGQVDPQQDKSEEEMDVSSSSRCHSVVKLFLSCSPVIFLLQYYII